MRSLAAIVLLAQFLHSSAAALATPEAGTWETYTVSAATQNPGGLGYTAAAVLAEEQLPEYGRSFRQLQVEVTPETASRLHIKVKPKGAPRYEVPDFIVQRPGANPDLNPASIQYSVVAPSATPALGEPLAISVGRKGGAVPLFDTTGHRFIFKDQYIEFTTNIPEDSDLYGLGEVTLPTGLLLPRNGRVITMWSRDFPCAFPDVNLYGSHPFYLQVNKDGSSHGVLLLNSNGMDVTLNPTTINYRVIGGLVDLYFFTGPTPEEVIRQYHQVIGHTALPPYWALGLHQSRWGYRDVDTLAEVVANYSSAGLPLETLWSDIEYMPKRFWTMEMDEFRYPADRMKQLVEGLHANGQHWIAITDAGVAADQGYAAYEEGERDSVFIKAATGDTYMGQVWPGKAVYPDHMGNPATRSWLTRHLQLWHEKVPYDGLWLDMNEASNFCSGVQCVPDTANETAMYWLTVETPHDFDISALIPHRTTCQMSCQEPTAADTLDNPPYAIQQTWGLKLYEKTISPSATHANGMRHYDTHNLFGTGMAMNHHAAFKTVTGKRPFLLSRSTFPGAGKWTAHWTGDNAANWENLYWSIAGILNTNMWGMAMVGADICGFLDELVNHPGAQLPPDELQHLCVRWASAGAFYPFSRNHFSYNSRPHEYYRWPDVAAAAKKAFTLRYQLLTYMYGSMYLAHAKGGTMARALLFTDPSDLNARNATKQWLLGDSVLVSPVITPHTNSLTAYFTAGSWYSAWDYSRLDMPQGAPVKLRVPVGDIAVHYRGGSIIPMQQYAPVTKDVRLSPITLVIALPAQPSTGSLSSSSSSGGPVPPYALEQTCAAAHARSPGQLVSCGHLFMDGGEDVNVSTDNSVQVWYTAVASETGDSGVITNVVKSNTGSAQGKLVIEAVHILGVPKTAPSTILEAAPLPQVRLNGQTLDTGYDAAAGVIKLTGLSIPVAEPLQLRWRI